jgi:hypothetical protein
MSPDREILTALLWEVSRQSASFQSLIHDYSADVMNDPEVHCLFTARLDASTIAWLVRLVRRGNSPG